MQLNSNVRAVGKRVLLQILENKQWKDNGGIIIPETISDKTDNQKLLKAKVISIGEEAKVMGLQIGDVVQFDKFAQYSPTNNGRATDEVGDYVLVDFDKAIITYVEQE